MFHKNWSQPVAKRKWGDRRWFTVAVAAIAVLTVLASGIVKLCLNHITANVRSTTVQVISELTASKALILSSILEEMSRDMLNLALALEAANDAASVHSILKAFQESHDLKALTVLDKDNHVLYGDDYESLAMKGIPDDFVQQVKASGFAVSDTILGVDGEREILFGAVVSGRGFVFGVLSADSLQRACGEYTYIGEGYSYILKRNGDIIIPPIRYSLEQVYENIRVLLSDSGNQEDKLSRFMAALSDGRSGSVIFTINGQEQILCFNPVETDKEWQFVTVVPLASAERDGAQVIRTAAYMASMIIAMIAMALAAGVLFYLSAQRKEQKNDRFLRDIYQAISENTDTVIFILNSKTSRPDYVFENSGRLLGIPAEEFLNSQVQEAGQSGFYRELQMLLMDQWPKEGCQRQIHTYNDRLHRDMWLKVLICPFQLGNEAKCIYAITDITKEHNDRENIIAAVVAAEQANAAKSSFFSNMSHDMRTPMNGIVGMTAIARNNLDNKEKISDCLNKIDFSSKHLLGLINDVLDMSKIENGKLALISEPLDLSEFFLELEAILKCQCDDRDQSLTFVIKIIHNHIMGDSVRLKQVFMNLLSNAVKFTPKGGAIVLTAQEQEQQNPDFAIYRFTVADNGIGMSSDFQKVIFTPFERAENSIVHRTEGTGLGMAITKNLVSAMGGRISLKSQAGKGTTFFVDLELPLQEAYIAERTDSRELQLNENFFKGKRFLLAEDNAINQEIAVELLSRYGAKVEVAGDGKQALERFMESAGDYYDAILMDIQMPLMNGYEATMAIRSSSHSKAKTIPIIAMTANVLAEDILAARNAGMDAHIPKPLNPEQVCQVLKERMDDPV